jgi:hypothetical protein
MNKKLDIFLEKKIANADNLLSKNNVRRNEVRYTIPSRNLYPHQWSWDSGWIVYGYCAMNQINKAEQEIISLFKYQWKNGLVPSIVFHSLDNNSYWPSPDVWNLAKDAKEFTDKPNSTGIIQPPIHSSACLKIYESNSDKIKAKQFLQKIYNKLILWHKYLYEERDPNDEGLVFIRHPWESGMDNSPIWDSALERIKITDYKYSKYRTDNKKVNSEERPTDLTYERYMRLIEIYKECKYNEKEIVNKSEFIIQDVLFNVLLLKSNYALKKIAEILEEEDDIKIINNWINKTYKGIDKLYADNFYYDFDLKTNKIINVKTISGLAPIQFKNKTKEIISVLKKEFLDIENDNYLISSLSRKDEQYDPINYWRGPSWINLSWLIISGLEDTDLADKIKMSCVEKIEKLGFYEYFDSKNNSGCGDNHFSWTAAIYICLILNVKF